ncbi:MAG: DUF5996 family protein [Myxococcota bacterium]
MQQMHEHTLDDPHAWPPLPLAEWRDTYATVHLWTQIVGKIRMKLTPPLNHWWHVPLYVTSRGLTTSPIPYGEDFFEIDFDFVDHTLRVRTSGGPTRALPLIARTVADFEHELFAALSALGVDVRIYETPVEIPNPIPFPNDTVHRSYDPEAMQRCWRVLVATDAVLKEFRGEFLGKASPVHFFWGSFDLALTLFSGHRAPERPGADPITREAYSHEVLSFGFWPGGVTATGVRHDEPIFYAYAAPEPPGFSAAPVRPKAAVYAPQLGEFILPYEATRHAPSPREALLDFCRSVYVSGATLARWNRAELERHIAAPGP